LIESFTSRYGVHRLVWFEQHPDMSSAICRENELKKWIRNWKPNLIEAGNPEWNDLAIGPGLVPSDDRANGRPPLRG
jgi:putative endonuclease